MKSVVSKTILMAFVCGMSFVSCTNKEKEEAALAQVVVANSSKDSIENEMVKVMDEINKNLDMIRDKQGMVANTPSAENISKKEEILHNISLINVWMLSLIFSSEWIHKTKDR